MKKLVYLLSLLSLLILATSPVMAYNISLSPVTQNVEAGGNAQVDVNLYFGPGQQLFGFNLGLMFDPNVVQFNSLVFSPLLTDYYSMFTAPPTSSDNQVTFSGALDWLAPAGATTDFVPLASLYFTPNAAGTSPLNLSGSILDINSWSEEQVGATGSLVVTPEPGTFTLVGIGVAGVLVLRRRLRLHKS